MKNKISNLFFLLKNLFQLNKTIFIVIIIKSLFKIALSFSNILSETYDQEKLYEILKNIDLLDVIEQLPNNIDTYLSKQFSEKGHGTIRRANAKTCHSKGSI